MVFVLDGSIAIPPASPTANEAWRSNRGVQLSPPSALRQTPPPAVPMKMILLLFGWTAIAETKPLSSSPAGLGLMGLGPIGVQTDPVRVIVRLPRRNRHPRAAWAARRPLRL